MTERILVPIDGSPQSEQVLQHALRLPDIEVVVLTVINPFDTDPNTIGLQTPTGIPGMPGYSEEWYEKAREKVRDFHDEIQEKVTLDDVPWSSEIKVGEPARHIIGYAEENDIDEIIIGSHDRSDLSRLLLGSVAERVVRRAPVPVTVVR